MMIYQSNGRVSSNCIALPRHDDTGSSMVIINRLTINLPMSTRRTYAVPSLSCSEQLFIDLPVWAGNSHALNHAATIASRPCTGKEGKKVDEGVDTAHSTTHSPPHVSTQDR